MTSHCRAALEAAGLPLDPPRMSDVLRPSLRCSSCLTRKPYADFPKFAAFNVYAHRTVVCNDCRDAKSNQERAA
jgi:hypothetical protein